MTGPEYIPTERDLVEAREILIKVWEEKYTELKTVSEFEATIIAEAEELREYLVEQDTRTFCVLVVSFMEDALRRRFIQSWNISGRAEENSYFGGNGPLSTFSQRLTVAKGVGWITEEMSQQANILRKIRNEFAHNHRVHNFEHEPLRSFAESLNTMERAWYQERMNLYRDALDQASRETVLRIRVYCNSIAIVGQALARSKLLAEGLPANMRAGDDGWSSLTGIEQAFTDQMIIFSFNSLGITKSSGEPF